jgi:5-carboxymethyl-2-hydroxymuconate isomerase
MLSFSPAAVNRQARGTSMPHVVTEYSANLEGAVDIRALVDDLHATAIASGLFEVGGIRSRAKRREIFQVADGDPANGFVFIMARIAPGRTPEKRKALGEALLATASKRLEPVFASRGLSLAVEIQELDGEYTFRRNNLHERIKAKQAKGAVA